ncbi:MAG: DUF6452 family protein [Candidatus Amulumruptor caecigallinarius]|nr:DUF6452 family protein [Candidatus Amulumruptor caecigallinarius]
MKIFNAMPAVAAVVVCGLFAACNDDDCADNQNALPLAGFYSSVTPGEKIMMDSLEVRGIGAPGDSVLSAATVAKDQLYIPFRIDSDTTIYVFKYLRSAMRQHNIADTITFIYSRSPRFVSEECGVSYVFDIRDIEVKGAMIDSVVSPEGFIDNTNVENLRIYFSTNPALSPNE